MKAHEKLILTYIGKYHRLDLSVLVRELQIYGRMLADILERLYKEAYFEFTEDEVRLTEKGKLCCYQEWNPFTEALQTEEEAEEFDWQTVYVPKDFKGT